MRAPSGRRVSHGAGRAGRDAREGRRGRRALSGRGGREGDREDDEEDEELSLEETVELATERLAREPENVTALLYRGEALEELGKTAEARADLERAASLAPASASAQLAWARFLFAQNDEDRALSACEKAIEIGEGSSLHDVDRQTDWDDIGRARARYLKAAIQAAGGQFEDALAELDRSLAFDEEESRALLLRGEMRHATGDLKGALEDLQAAVDEDSEDPEARLALAETLLDAGDAAKAFLEVEAAIDLAGEKPSAEMLVVRGEVRLAKGNILLANEDFTRAAKLSPEAVEPMLGIVDCALAANDLDAAEVASKKAIELDPEHTQALVFKARVDLARGRPAEAEKACTRAIEYDAEAADALALRAEARKKLGKHDAARHDSAAARALGFHVEEIQEEKRSSSRGGDAKA
ncbi:tetratricopeptide repeat protein [bacterium]|nr:tetratricopeptide repeat protein [bacterium]